MINNLKETFRYSIIHPRYLAEQELLKIVSIETNNFQGNLLDVGCGKKPYVNLFSNVIEYIGLDLPSTMHGHSLVDVFATSLSLPIKDQCIDSVLCTEVLEHTPDPLRALQEI